MHENISMLSRIITCANGARSSGYSVRLVVGRIVFNSLAESDQKTLKVGIHSFPVLRSTKKELA